MRRANGSGSIFKVKDAKRRKPWRVNVTLGVVINADVWLIVRIIFNSPVSESYFRYVMQKVDNVFECIDNNTFKQTYNVKSFSIVPIDYEF